MDARVPFSIVLAAFGLAATVARPGDASAISTQVAWLPAQPDEVPFGLDHQALHMRKVLAFPRATVATVPTGTVVMVAEESGGSTRRFVVDQVIHQEADHTRAVMKLAEQ